MSDLAGGPIHQVVPRHVVICCKQVVRTDFLHLQRLSTCHQSQMLPGLRINDRCENIGLTFVVHKLKAIFGTQNVFIRSGCHLTNRPDFRVPLVNLLQEFKVIFADSNSDQSVLQGHESVPRLDGVDRVNT